MLVSILAVIEYEELEKKCQDYYEKVSILFGNFFFLYSIQLIHDRNEE